jgi:hypothetical protein
LLTTAQQVALEANVILTQSEHGSVVGELLSLGTRTRIEDWLEQHSWRDGFSETDWTSVISRAVMTPQGSTDYGSEITATPYGPPGARPSLDKELAKPVSVPFGFAHTFPSRDFEIEEIRASLRLAQSAFGKADPSTGWAFLNKAASLAARSSVDDFWEISQTCLENAERELKRGIMKNGKQDFGSLIAAKGLFEKAFDVAPQTLRDSQIELLLDAQLKMAVCCFRIGIIGGNGGALDFVRALKTGKPPFWGELGYQEGGAQFLEASLLLAEIYLTEARLIKAKAECENILKWISVVPQNHSHFYYRTLALRPFIMVAEGDLLSAEFSQEVIRKAIQDGKDKEISLRNEQNCGEFEMLRGISSIDAVLGLVQIKEGLARDLMPPIRPDPLLLYACRLQLRYATSLLLTGRFPTPIFATYQDTLIPSIFLGLVMPKDKGFFKRRLRMKIS